MSLTKIYVSNDSPQKIIIAPQYGEGIVWEHEEKTIMPMIFIDRIIKSNPNNWKVIKEIEI